jgi:hypothetical protein
MYPDNSAFFVCAFGVELYLVYQAASYFFGHRIRVQQHYFVQKDRRVMEQRRLFMDLNLKQTDSGLKYSMFFAKAVEVTKQFDFRRLIRQLPRVSLYCCSFTTQYSSQFS